MMTLVVRDDDDVLDANLRYHLSRGVEHVFLLDHRSTTQTRRIAQRVGGEHLTYLRENGRPYRQAEWSTTLARMAAARGADWVVHTDADEFWWPQAADIGAALGGLPAEVDGVLAPRLNFVPIEAASEASFYKRMTVRQRVSLNPGGWPLPGKVAHRASSSVEVGMGNHTYRAADLAPPIASNALEILHFPIRGLRQFESKVAKYDWWDDHGGERREWRRQYRAGQLAEAYRELVLDQDAVKHGLSDGTLVRDERLLNAFA